MMQLLLLSNSRTPAGDYLTHAVEPVRALLRGRRRALFIPYAGVTLDWDAYTDKVRVGVIRRTTTCRESIPPTRNPATNVTRSAHRRRPQPLSPSISESSRRH